MRNFIRKIYLQLRNPGAQIQYGAKISVESRLSRSSKVLSGAIVNNVELGRYSYIGRNSLVQHATIGNYCSIANNVSIGLGSHPLDRFSTSPIFYKKSNTFGINLNITDIDYQEFERINIGNDVWIGANAIILDGVTLGTGSVVGAGAVVTKDLPPYSIAVGVPAKIIKQRFDNKTIKELLEKIDWSLKPDDLNDLFQQILQ